MFMKIKFSLAVALVAIVVFSSCRKDASLLPMAGPSSSQSSQSPNYTQLAVGNYWVYKKYIIDENNNVTNMNYPDSCVIEKDSVINGSIYYKYVIYFNYDINWPNNSVGIIWLRDSLSYLKSLEGQVLFSSADFTNEFDDGYFLVPGSSQDTVCKRTFKMDSGITNISAPAGNYNCLVAKQKQEFFAPFDAFGSVKYATKSFSRGIGMVSELCPFANSNDWMERKLLRYHVQ